MGQSYSFTLQETELQGRIEICPRYHNTSVTKLGPKPMGPDVWSPGWGYCTVSRH